MTKISTIGHAIGDWTKKQVSGVKKTSSKIGHAVGDAVHSTGKYIDHAIGAVHKDARDLVSGAGKIVMRGEDVVDRGITTIGDTASNLGESLSMPLMLAGGAALLYMMSQQSR